MPYSGQARFRGVGLRHSTCEPVEQRGAIFSGDGGGKGADQGEHRSVQHEPDTEREISVTGAGRCASGSKGKEAGTVYCFAPKGRACPARTGEILNLLVKGGEFKPNGLKP